MKLPYATRCSVCGEKIRANGLSRIIPSGATNDPWFRRLRHPRCEVPKGSRRVNPGGMYRGTK